MFPLRKPSVVRRFTSTTLPVKSFFPSVTFKIASIGLELFNLASITAFPIEIAFVNSVQNMHENLYIKDSEPPRLSDDQDQSNTSIKSSVEDDEKDTSSPTTNGITITELNILWKEIISSSRSSHHTLPALLEWCVPVSVDNDMVQIGVKEQFALSKLDKPEMIIYLQNAIMAASGHSLSIQFTLMDIRGNAEESIDVPDDGAVAMGVELGAKVRERSLRRK